MKAVNLLPSDQRNAAVKPTAAGPAAKPGPDSNDPFAAFFVLGALAFAVVAVALYVLAGNTVEDRKTELANVTAETQVVQAKVGALQPYADFQQMATQRVATVMQLAGSRFDWEQSLRDVSRALPRNVHLKSVKGSVSNTGASGGSALRSALPAPALELSGCTRGQTQVARLMSRMRAVRGVTRVALAKSDKDATETAVAAPTTGVDGTQFEQGSLCSKGSPPAFEIVLFFERSAVAPPASNVPGAAAAAANGASAQPNATATPTPAPGGTQPAQPNSTSPAQPAQPAQPGGTSSTTQGVSTP